MEGLLILVGEFFAIPVFAGITALIELAIALVDLLSRIVLGKALPRRSGQQKKKFSIPPNALKWMRRAFWSTLSISVTTFLLLNFVFLESGVRYATQKVVEKTGIAIEFQSVEGNLFSGEFAFTDVLVIQDKPESPQFNIQVKEVRANLSVIGLLFGNRTLESALVSNAKIAFEVPPQASESEPKEKSLFGFGIRKTTEAEQGEGEMRFAIRRLPRYQINELVLSNVNIDLTDWSSGKAIKYPISISRFEAEPLRSHYLWFDILFRTNLNAQLDGSALTILNKDNDGLRHTHWSIREIQAPVLASLVGGPFLLFEKGSLDVAVTDEWEIDNRADIEMDWELKARDVVAIVPDRTPVLIQPLAAVVVNNLNTSEKEWDFGFKLSLSEAQFEGTASLNAKQIWRDALPAILKQASEISGFETDTIKETTTKVFEGFKKFLQDREEKAE